MCLTPLSRAPWLHAPRAVPPDRPAAPRRAHQPPPLPSPDRPCRPPGVLPPTPRLARRHGDATLTPRPPPTSPGGARPHRSHATCRLTGWAAGSRPRRGREPTEDRIPRRPVVSLLTSSVGIVRSGRV